MAVELESQGQLQEVLDILRKRKWQVVLPAVFVTAVGVVFAVIVPKKYVVETTVEVHEQRSRVGDGEESVAQRELSSAPEHIRNYARVRDVIQHQNWMDFTRLSSREQHEFVQSVRNNIAVNVRSKAKGGGSTFVDVEYADVDPNRAVKFLKELTARWIEDVLDWERHRLRRDFEVLQNLVETTRADLDVARKNRDAMRKEMGLPIAQAEPGSQREADPVHTALVSAIGERDRVAHELEAARARLDERREKLREAPRTVDQEVEEPGVQLAKELSALELQITEQRRIQAGKTEQHSAYRRAERRIAQIEEQIETAKSLERERTSRSVKVPNPELTALRQSVNEAEEEVRSLEVEHEAWGDTVAKRTQEFETRSERATELAHLEDEVVTLRGDLAEGHDRLRRVRSELEVVTKAQADPARVVQEPVPPSEPTEPNPVLLVLFFAVGGLGLGLAAAFLAEFSRTCFRSVHEISRVMGVPVLGAVGQIRTRQELRRGRVRRAVVAGSTAVILLGLGWFAWAWAEAPETLPTEVVRAVEDFQLRLR